MAEPLRFHGQIPAPLLLVQTTQQHVHLTVVLTIAMFEIRTTRHTLARSHIYRGHLSFPSLLSASMRLPYADSAATGSPLSKPEVIS